MKSSYLNFDLLFRHKTGGYQATISSLHGEADLYLEFPFSENHLEFHRLLSSGDRRSTRNERGLLGELKTLGGKLFEAVFRDQARTLLMRNLEAARAQETGIRIRLDLSEVPELAELPWECLYDRQSNRFLVFSDITIVRVQSVLEPIRTVSLRPPLRVLVMLSNPHDAIQVDVEGEWNRLLVALNPLERRELVKLERMHEATPAALYERLRSGKYHVFHFIGHEAFDGLTKESTLILEGEDKSAYHLISERLGLLLSNHRSLRLTILQTCEGATPYPATFSQSAYGLLQQGVSAVVTVPIAMTSAAVTLNAELYRGLVEGHSVDAAMDFARQAVFVLGSGIEWFKPCLYTGVEDLSIFRIQSPSETNVEVTNTPIENSLSAPAGPLKLEDPQGTMDPSSPFYIQRTADKIALAKIHEGGVIITIKGPRQVGKSSLLIRISDLARNSGKRVAFLDFQLFDQQAFRDSDVFFRQFCVLIAESLGIDSGNLDRFWNSPLQNAHRCSRFVQHSLEELGVPVLLAMDEVDSLFDTDFRTSFFSMLRAWHNNRAQYDIWNQLDMALVTSTEPYFFIANLNQSPFNVGEVISLEDFTPDEVAELDRRHGSLLLARQRNELMTLSGGHPYIVRLALYLVASERLSVDKLFSTATAPNGPFDDHLRRQLYLVRGKEKMVDALRQVMRYHRCDDEEVLFRLQGAGLVRRVGKEVVMRCQLYEEFFKEVFQ